MKLMHIYCVHEMKKTNRELSQNVLRLVEAENLINAKTI